MQSRSRANEGAGSKEHLRLTNVHFLTSELAINAFISQNVQLLHETDCSAGRKTAGKGNRVGTVGLEERERHRATGDHSGAQRSSFCLKPPTQAYLSSSCFCLRSLAGIL